MSTLEELYNGNINPSQRFIKKGSEYQKLNKQLAEYLDEFTRLLNDEEKQLYDKIEDNILGLVSISEKECFIEGFCIGAQIMWEILHFKSPNFL